MTREATPDDVLAGQAQWCVVEGDATAVLAAIPGDSAHVCYSDPPYGLSDHGADDVLRCLQAWLSGQVYTHCGRGFMGKEWDAFVPGPEVWREVYRVLKPGAYCVAFSSTRTVDLLGIAMRIAGGEMRDGWAWLQGQGFPKNLDVSKAIDKQNGETGRAHKFTEWMRSTGLTARAIDAATGTAMGSHYLSSKSQPAIPTPEIWSILRPLCLEVPAWVDDLVERIEAEREILREHPNPAGSKGNTFPLGQKCNVTAPGCDAARQWSGYGTTTKPAYEPLVVTRRPLDGTVASNVLAHGCGTLNIDRARIGYEATQDPASNPLYRKMAGYANANANDDGSSSFAMKDGSGERNPCLLGRFPANLALVHDEGCELVGHATAKTGMATFKSTETGAEIGSYPGGLRRQEHGEYGFADSDGMEIVDEWRCTETCAVAELARQSGERMPGKFSTKTKRGMGYGKHEVSGDTGHAWCLSDTGTAARYFYQGKAANSDRLAYLSCVEGCSRHGSVCGAESARKDVREANKALPPEKRERAFLCPQCGQRATVYEHPTVKPYDLAAYHARLLSLPVHVRPVAIVPFCGTGVEARALLDVGFRVIAIDIDPRHVAMTKHRLGQDIAALQNSAKKPAAPTAESPPVGAAASDPAMPSLDQIVAKATRAVARSLPSHPTIAAQLMLFGGDR